MLRSIIQYAASRVPKRYRVPVATQSDGSLGNGWVTGYTNLRFPAVLTKRGANDLPGFDYSNIGLLFPENNDGEVIYIIGQLPYSRTLGSSIFPHIHFVQDEANTPVFKMDYRWYENNTELPGFTTASATDFQFSYSSGSIVQIAKFPEISGDTILGNSSIFEAKVYRDDSNVSGDVLFKEFDLHFLSDNLGTMNPYS